MYWGKIGMTTHKHKTVKSRPPIWAALISGLPILNTPPLSTLLQISKAKPEILDLQNHYSLNSEFIPETN